jgi:beta-galactosidase GanA
MARNRSFFEIVKVTFLRLSAVGCVLVLSSLAAQIHAQEQPHLRRQGNATQLIVNGVPFLIRGGELGNSTASDLISMTPVWPKLVKLNLNTVLMPIYWELIEPEEGKFDFTLVDGLIRDARRNQLKLVPLWFGSWKNSMSSYAPAWVKRDQKRFPRSRDRSGNGMEILSPFSDENAATDARAFRALMRHLKQIDSREQTVVMVQVENEIGMIPDSRDRSDIANRSYGEPVPAELTAYLERRRETLAPELRAVWSKAGFKTRGSWEEVFGVGIGTEEIFMAWHFARFTERVAAAGKAEYAIPMFVNAALIRPGHVPGQYPSAGPLPHLMDIWRAGAASIDFLSPDIYFRNFAEWCRKYDRDDNAFFIPEAGSFPSVAVNMLYAVGQHNAIGISPFAIESWDEDLGGNLAAAYDLLRQLEPVILAHQGRGESAGLLPEGAEQRQPLRMRLNGYALNVTFERAADGTPEPLSGGLVIALGPDEFIFAGVGLTITFDADSPGDPLVGLLAVDEGRYTEGRWVAGRRLNGDQTHQGRHVRLPAGKFGIQRVKLYRYR